MKQNLLNVLICYSSKHLFPRSCFWKSMIEYQGEMFPQFVPETSSSFRSWNLNLYGRENHVLKSKLCVHPTVIHIIPILSKIARKCLPPANNVDLMFCRALSKTFLPLEHFWDFGSKIPDVKMQVWGLMFDTEIQNFLYRRWLL